MAKKIKQKVVFRVSPHEVYEALMDSKKHAAFTGAAADISREKGGKFTAYDDYIEGENLELVPDKKIVQKWRANDWPKGHYSTLTFKFEEINGGTKLTMVHDNVPNNDTNNIDKGWHDYYWKPLKRYLEFN